MERNDGRTRQEGNLIVIRMSFLIVYWLLVYVRINVTWYVFSFYLKYGSCFKLIAIPWWSFIDWFKHVPVSAVGKTLLLHAKFVLDNQKLKKNLQVIQIILGGYVQNFFLGSWQLPRIHNVLLIMLNRITTWQVLVVL